MTRNTRLPYSQLWATYYTTGVYLAVTAGVVWSPADRVQSISSNSRVLLKPCSAD